MLETLITSKTRIKLLLRFFLNSKAESYLRNLETEFEESSNSIRLELNKFEKAGLLTSRSSGNRKYFRANTTHPLYQDINNLLHKYIGLDQIIEKVIGKLGDVIKVYVAGDFAKGLESRIIDLLFIGDSINREYLANLVERAEELINHKIRYLIFTEKDFVDYRNSNLKEPLLLLWEGNQ